MATEQPTMPTLEPSPEPRPPLGSWTRLYGLVLGLLALDILLLYALMRAFA